MHDRSVSPGGAFVSLVSCLRAHLLRKSPYHADPRGNGCRDNLSPHTILAAYTAPQSRDDVGNSALSTGNHLQRLVFRVGYARLCGAEEHALLKAPAMLSPVTAIQNSYLSYRGNEYTESACPTLENPGSAVTSHALRSMASSAAKESA